MLRRLKTGPGLLGCIVFLAACSGGGGGGGEDPPPAEIRRFSVTLTELRLTRSADGAEVPVEGLPLSSNITVTLDD